MRRVRIEAWCDFCWLDSEQLVERARTFCVGVVEGENLRPVVRLVETCETHAEIFDELLDGVLGSAEPISANATTPKPNAQAPKRDSQAALFRDSEHKPPSALPHQCPLCPVTMTRQSLISHIWTIHRPDEKRPKPTRKCPECGHVSDSLGACGQHRRNVHGHDQLVAALAGVYSGPPPRPIRELTR